MTIGRISHWLRNKDSKHDTFVPFFFSFFENLQPGSYFEKHEHGLKMVKTNFTFSVYSSFKTLKVEIL